MNNSKKDTHLNSSFYTHFYNEEVYIIKEKHSNIPVTNPAENTLNEPIAEEENRPSITINGKHDSDLLIMFDNPKAAGMNAPDKDFFINILKATGRKPADVAALNTANLQNTGWAEIVAASKARFIIAFGVPLSLLPEKIQMGEVTNAGDKIILAVEPLAIVSGDDNKKRVLWNGMRKIFNL